MTEYEVAIVGAGPTGLMLGGELALAGVDVVGEPGSLDIAPWADRVRSIHARYTGPWELPVIGQVRGPAAVLIRPDGYVAWVGDANQLGLAEALTTWFGPATVA